MNARIPALVLQPSASKVASVFTSGNSQAVRIPKEFQLKTKQVTIIQRGDELVLKPKYKTFGELLANLPKLTAKEAAQWDKAMEAISEIRKEPAQERDWDHLFGDDLLSTHKKAPLLAPNKVKK